MVLGVTFVLTVLGVMGGVAAVMDITAVVAAVVTVRGVVSNPIIDEDGPGTICDGYCCFCLCC